MLAQWGMDDCWTWLAPQGVGRPEWLDACDSDARAMVVARKRFGSLVGAYEGLAGDCGMRRVSRAEPGDRVLGMDREVGLTAGVVQDDCTCMIRTQTGYRVARWKQVLSVWRPESPPDAHRSTYSDFSAKQVAGQVSESQPQQRANERV